MKRRLGTPNPAHQGCESHHLETLSLDLLPTFCKDHAANKEYRYGCSIDCGGTPMRVYERTLSSQGGWTSMEDYLQAGSALWYGENQRVHHGQDKVALMTSEADPIGFERADSNGMPIQAELEPCLCIAFSAGVCGPSLEGCASSCEEMPNLLPPGVHGKGGTVIPTDKEFYGLGAVVIGVIQVGIIGGSWYLGGCAGASIAEGVAAGVVCSKYGYKNCDKLAHCLTAGVARKCGTIAFSWCLGWIKELLPGKDRMSPDDFAAKHQGEKCAVSGPGLNTCVQCCGSWWVKRWLK